MRASTLVATLLLLAGLAPTASAAPTSLALELPEGALAANSTIPVTIRLTISQYMCHEDVELPVTLSTNTTEGVKAVFERSTVNVPLPARSRFADEETLTVTVNLTTRAIRNGTVELAAMLVPAEREECFAPGGFEAASGAAMREVVVASAGAPAAGSQEQPPEEPVASTPRQSAPRPTTCAPGKSCGTVGGYATPQESAGSNDTPGAGAIGAMVALCAAALALRRR